MMSKKKACRQQTLAKNPTGQVQWCGDCGTVSLHIGPMTIRIDEIGLESLTMLLAQATEQLELHKAYKEGHFSLRDIA